MVSDFSYVGCEKSKRKSSSLRKIEESKRNTERSPLNETDKSKYLFHSLILTLFLSKLRDMKERNEYNFT